MVSHIHLYVVDSRIVFNIPCWLCVTSLTYWQNPQLNEAGCALRLGVGAALAPTSKVRISFRSERLDRLHLSYQLMSSELDYYSISITDLLYLSWFLIRSLRIKHRPKTTKVLNICSVGSILKQRGLACLRIFAKLILESPYPVALTRHGAITTTVSRRGLRFRDPPAHDTSCRRPRRPP